MILHELMLYVDKPRQVAEFWKQNFGFLEHVTEEAGIFKIELRPHQLAETTIVLFERAVIAELEPELDLATPSLLFGVPAGELDALYATLKAKRVPVGELVTTPDGMRVFNFADPEGRYFAVRELH